MFVIIRFDSERDIVKVGESKEIQEAQTIMQNDFKIYFNQKYGYEMTENNCNFEEMYEEAEACGECEIGKTSAWINDYNHYDFDWAIFEVGANSTYETKKQANIQLRNGAIEWLRLILKKVYQKN